MTDMTLEERVADLEEAQLFTDKTIRIVVDKLNELRNQCGVTAAMPGPSAAVVPPKLTDPCPQNDCGDHRMGLEPGMPSVYKCVDCGAVGDEPDGSDGGR